VQTLRPAYITHAASELPGDPVPNEAIERYLGVLHEGRERLRERVLRNNGIRNRHYAIDPETGRPNATLAELQARAIRRLLERASLPLDDVDLLACSTAVPEVITPGVASLVHGELGGRPIEIASAGGVCASSMSALKYATMAVQTHNAHTAVVGGAERTSSHLRTSHFQSELEARRVDEDDPHIALGAEFLRWMLSDGAGAVLLRDRPAPDALSLRVEWVQLVSFANELPTCMYMGGKPTDAGGLASWRDTDDLQQAVREGYFNLRQDVGLLRDHIVPVTTWRTLEQVRKTRSLAPSDVDWVLPHFSSNLFRQPALDAFREAGFDIPDDRIRSNLSERGNIGSASVFVMIDDLMASGDLRAGDGILAVVPESGRFNTGYMLLRVVEPG
jgi:3-oxoacyl-[acyl-carrier-protein] synthase-3